MRGGSGSCDFLALWEDGAQRHPLDRALDLIAVFEGTAREQAATLSIDGRNRALYGIVAQLFGDAISLIATCGECATEIEITFSTRDALAVPATAERIAIAGGAAWCRLPTSRDLAAALAAPDAEKALLAEVVEGDVDDPALLAEAERTLATQAGLADVSLEYRCDRCGTEGEAAFDVLDYLWRRIVAEARNLLREVHIIAAAYGWSNEAVLALSPPRRAAHIALIDT